MAKVSKVNVAITGDSSGLQRAGDQAQATMRRLRAQADATGKSLGGFKGQANQLAEGLTKLGVGGRALQGVGALAGLGQLGLGAATMGTAGLAFGGIALAAVSVNALADSYAALRKDASEAAEAMRSGVRTAEEWRAKGFTQEGGLALAGYAQRMGPAPLGFSRAFTQTEAIRGGPSSMATFMETMPTVLGSALSQILAGEIPDVQTTAQAAGSDLQAYRESSANLAISMALPMFVRDMQWVSDLSKWMSR